MKMVNYAQLIIQKTKLGGAFVGLIFVSLITSIPELITEISQGILGKPDVGISDDIGSNAFSMFALSFVILIFIKKLYIDKISKLTIITIFISLTLSIFVTFVFKYQLDYNVGYAGTFSVGITSIFLLFCYLIFVFFTYKNRHLADPEPKILIKSNKTIKQIFILFIFYSIFLILVAISLNASVNAMQHQYKISSKSAGGLFLSITTSMPEIIALIVFAKSGFLSAAISSIVGSHIFNLSAIF
jgi:cation:H+ antiporter